MANVLLIDNWTLHGVIRDGTFRAERRAGSFDPSHPGTLDQLRTLRALGHAARKNRPVLARLGPGNPIPNGPAASLPPSAGAGIAGSFR